MPFCFLGGTCGFITGLGLMDNKRDSDKTFDVFFKILLNAMTVSGMTITGFYTGPIIIPYYTIRRSIMTPQKNYDMIINI